MSVAEANATGIAFAILIVLGVFSFFSWMVERERAKRAEARGRAVRVAVENMRARSSALYRGHCRPTAGRLTLAVELWQFADEVDRANDVLPPRPPWEPRHGYGTPEMAGMGVIQGG